MNFEYEYITLIKNIKKYRIMNNLTQEQLAEMTDLSSSYIKQIESQRYFKNITINTLFKIAKALNINVSDLFSQTTQKTKIIS